MRNYRPIFERYPDDEAVRTHFINLIVKEGMIRFDRVLEALDDDDVQA